MLKESLLLLTNEACLNIAQESKRFLLLTDENNLQDPYNYYSSKLSH